MHVMHYAFSVDSDAFGTEHSILIATCCMWLDGYMHVHATQVR